MSLHLFSRRRGDGNRRETIRKPSSKFFGDHVKQASEVGTMAATLDVAVPFVHAMKKSHHDFMLRCKTEMNTSFEQKMQSEMLPMPVLKELIVSEFLLSNMELTTNMQQSLLKLKEFTKSTNSLLYIYAKEKHELFLCPNHIHSPTHRVNFLVDDERKTLAIYVALTKKYVVTDNVLKDSRFPLGLGYSGICNEVAMGIPVLSSSDDLIAVMELSKKSGLPPYRKKDELAAVNLAKWMGSSIGITTEIQMFTDRHQFFNYIKHIVIYYSSVGDFPFENILTHLMTFTEQYFRASYGRLYVVEKIERDGKYESQLNMFAKPQSATLYVKTDTDSIGVTNTIAQTVMKTKKGVNLSGYDLQNYAAWFEDDILSSVMCEPVLGKSNKVAGAIELCNKCGGVNFTNDDEVAFGNLAKYLSVMLKYYKLSARKKKLKAKIGLYTEMLSSHIYPSETVLEKMKESIQVPKDLFSYEFFPTDHSNEYLSKLIVIMLDDTLGTCHFPELNLSKFVITLAKAHDNKPEFTNFLHTFTVFHCVTIIIHHSKELFTKLEKEYMLMAALFHCFGISSLNVKYSKGHSFASFSSHYVNLFFKIFKHSDKSRIFWVNMLIKACAERNPRRFHSGLCKFILKDLYSWDNEIHRFYTMALIMRVSEDAMWYKEFQYTAYMSRRLLTQMRKQRAEINEYYSLQRKKGSRIKRIHKEIKGKDFIISQINDLRTKCLPNIEILMYLLPGVEPLIKYSCKTLEQWELILNAEDCNLWEHEMSWPKITEQDKDIYFSTIDFFVKEISTDLHQKESE